MKFASLLALAAFGSAAGAQASPLVDADWLAANLDDSDIAVLDIRNDIDGGSLEVYENGHIPGAVYTNYLQDGWRTKIDGVPAMVPSLAQLEAIIGNLGVEEDDHVVIVHGGVHASDFGSAARVYWTFKYLGHDEVSILDGGWRGWVADASRPVETGQSVVTDPTLFMGDTQSRYLVSTEEVMATAGDPKVLRIDARPEDHHRGAGKHKLAAAAGRIPNSIGLEQALFFSEDGRLLPVEQLDALVPEAVRSGEAELVISYCNTGHWAATNWFVLSEILGYDQTRLYDASMVGWTADPSRPLAIGDDVLDTLGRWVTAGES